MTDSLVSCEWLHNKLHEKGIFDLSGQAASDAVREAGLVLFDATYFLTDKTRDPYQEYVDEHIHGARYFDITRIADTSSPWPNTVPDQSCFEQAVRSLGCDNAQHVIAYDRLGLFSAARVWWLFRYFGHEAVSVLDGGLLKWKAEDLPTTHGTTDIVEGNFSAKTRPELLRSADQMMSIVDDHADATQIVDARGAGRFAGKSPEPREGLRAGHIPGSFNLPFDKLLNENKTLKQADEMLSIFQQAGIDLERPLVTSCGSGVTACILSLAMQQVGQADVPVFDGSWTEWGSRQELPVATID